MTNRKRCLIVDIDGTLIHTSGDLSTQITRDAVLLADVKDKLKEAEMHGDKIILTTGRRESAREETIQQLKSVGLYWDELIMDCGGGPRILVNDLKPNSDEPTAIAFSVDRNVGLGEVDLDLHKVCKILKDKIEKSWGAEEWILVNNDIAFKRIFIKAGHQTSLQYHKKKREVLMCVDGKGRVLIHSQYDGKDYEETFSHNRFVAFYPEQIHRIIADTDLLFYELSSPELDDVCRLEDGGAIKKEENNE